MENGPCFFFFNMAIPCREKAAINDGYLTAIVPQFQDDRKQVENGRLLRGGGTKTAINQLF